MRAPWAFLTGDIEWVEVGRREKTKSETPNKQVVDVRITRERRMKLSCGHFVKIAEAAGKKKMRCYACWWESPEGQAMRDSWDAKSKPHEPTNGA